MSNDRHSQREYELYVRTYYFNTGKKLNFSFNRVFTMPAWDANPEARGRQRAVIVIDVFIWSGHGSNEVKPMPAACSLLDKK